MNYNDENLIPIDLVVNNKDSRYLECFKLSTNDNCSLFYETKPEEDGRYTLIQIDDNGNKIDLIPKEYNIFSLIHEYGGNSITILNEPKSKLDNEFLILFSDYSTQDLYLYYPHRKNENPIKLVFSNIENYDNQCKLRFSNGTYNSKDQLVYMVCEDHRNQEKVLNYLVEINLKTKELKKINHNQSNDFYSYISLNSSNTMLSFIYWNFPNMPWDNTNLCILNLKTNEIINLSENLNESIMNPIWDSTSNNLYFISDLNGYWTIHKYDIENKKRSEIISSESIKFKEIGEPMWYFGRSYFGFITPTKLIASLVDYGLIIFNIETNEIEQIIKNEYSIVKTITTSPLLSSALIIGGSSSKMYSPIKINYDNQLKQCNFKQLLPDCKLLIPKLSIPIEIEFNTSSKNDGLNEKCFAYYYPPTLKISSPPPVLCKSHGGPTDRAYSVLNYEYQYWTSRGFAIIDVNYRGSSGFGKRYRKLLNSNWGIYDNDDCCNAVLKLVEMGLADKNKLFIDGGSAGGYTTLCCLTFKSVFLAGCSYYGVADLELLFKETHKFESRYQDILITEMNLNDTNPNCQWRKIYKERSPIYHLDLLNCPIALFHGKNDKVVPFNQSILIYQQLKSKNIKTILELNNEAHGFQSKDNIIKCLEYEYQFFCKLLNQLPIGIKYFNL